MINRWTDNENKCSPLCGHEGDTLTLRIQTTNNIFEHKNNNLQDPFLYIWWDFGDLKKTSDMWCWCRSLNAKKTTKKQLLDALKVHLSITMYYNTLREQLLTHSSPPPVWERKENVMSTELREAVTQTDAHWRSLEENGRMTSVASQSMAAPGPPEAWDTGKCKWGKSIDGETSFFSPAARP